MQRLEPSVPNLIGSEGDFTDAIGNLLKNAIHASKPGGRITISSSTEGKMIIIEVNDVGCGMSKEVLKRIFRPFFTTRAETGGSGMGMSRIQEAVNRLGGEIKVKSALGEGTTVTIRLPVAESKF